MDISRSMIGREVRRGGALLRRQFPDQAGRWGRFPPAVRHVDDESAAIPGPVSWNTRKGSRARTPSSKVLIPSKLSLYHLPQRPLSIGHASVQARLAESDLASILDHAAGGPTDQPRWHATGDSSLAQGTTGGLPAATLETGTTSV